MSLFRLVFRLVFRIVIRLVILSEAKDPQYFESGRGVESFLTRMPHTEKVGKMVAAWRAQGFFAALRMTDLKEAILWRDDFAGAVHHALQIAVKAQAVANP